MTQQFYDLNFHKLPDGVIRLEQTGYAGEAAVIDAHPEQVRYIARTLAGLKPDAAGKVADLERKLSVLTDKLQDIVHNMAFRTDILERIGDGFEHLAKLDGLLDLALEFDGGRLTPEYKDDAPPEAASASKAITPPSAIAQAKSAQPEATASSCTQLDLV